MSDTCSCHLRLARGTIVGAMAVLLPSALLWVCAVPASAATPCVALPRAQDELWLVSSRGLGSCDLEANVEQLKYWHYVRGQAWVRSDLAELVATDDPDVITVVFLHGNRIPSCEAFTKGWSAYRQLIRCADERPVRFVIWSWPSDKAGGPVEDARIKAARTNTHGYYLAWFIDQLNPDVPVGIWGHSFGARIATGALHLLGDGTLACRQLVARVSNSPRRMRAALLAAAVDCDWLLPGHCHGQALTQLDDLLLVNNCCDRLLQRYSIIYGRRSCREALGYNGLGIRRLSADDAMKVSQMNACCYVGKQHQFDNYLNSAAIMVRVRSHLLFGGTTATMETPASEHDNAASETVDAPAAEPVVSESNDPADVELVQP